VSFGPRDVSGLPTILASHLGQSRGHFALYGQGRFEGRDRVCVLCRQDASYCPVQDVGSGRLEENTRIVRDVEEIRRLKQRSGKDIYAVGGATLVSGLMNMGLIDEVRFLINPFILGGGKALFKAVKDRHVLKLVQAKAFKSGKVNMTYITQPDIKVLDSEKR
jgi:dihydrofolate reductase